MVTPKRPEATCLMPQFLPVPKRSAFSPPSPLLDMVPSPLRARAMVSCASGESEPSDIAPPTKWRTMESTDSTSSTGIGCAALKANCERRVTPLSPSMESV